MLLLSSVLCILSLPLFITLTSGINDAINAASSRFSLVE